MQDASINFWRKRVYQLIFFALSILLLYFLVRIGSTFKELVISFGAAIIISYLLGKPVEFFTKLIKIRALSVIIIFAAFIAFPNYCLAASSSKGFTTNDCQKA